MKRNDWQLRQSHNLSSTCYSCTSVSRLLIQNNVTGTRWKRSCGEYFGFISGWWEEVETCRLSLYTQSMISTHGTLNGQTKIKHRKTAVASIGEFNHLMMTLYMSHLRSHPEHCCFCRCCAPFDHAPFNVVELAKEPSQRAGVIWGMTLKLNQLIIKGQQAAKALWQT